MNSAGHIGWWPQFGCYWEVGFLLFPYSIMGFLCTSQSFSVFPPDLSPTCFTVMFWERFQQTWMVTQLNGKVWLFSLPPLSTVFCLSQSPAVATPSVGFFKKISNWHTVMMLKNNLSIKSSEFTAYIKQKTVTSIRSPQWKEPNTFWGKKNEI